MFKVGDKVTYNSTSKWDNCDREGIGVIIEILDETACMVIFDNKTKSKFCSTEWLSPVIEEVVNDPINPSHYTDGGIESIDYMKAKMTQEQFEGFLLGNVLKYTSRAGKKDDRVQDLKKAQWYLNRLVGEING